MAPPRQWSAQGLALGDHSLGGSGSHGGDQPSGGGEGSRRATKKGISSKYGLFSWPFMLQLLKFDSKSKGKTPLKGEFIMTGNAGKERKLHSLETCLDLSQQEIT